MPLRPDGTYYYGGDVKAPAPPPAPSTPIPPQTIAVPGSPEWWKGQKSSSPLNSFANALLPFMSPEDMKAVSTGLSALPEYESYKTAAYPTAPSAITSDLRKRYLSSQRATGALQALDNMRQLTGKSEAELGAGYTYLTDVIKAMQRLGTNEGGMSRAQYLEFQTTIKDLTASIQDNYDAAPYASLANYFASPTFSAGQLINTFSTEDKTYFGKRNKQLYE